ncbi:MAG: hypothetical protein EOM45_03085 [Clostridia bacterium]|nr:hypothetical protein [Clostridia bacterium]
MNERDLFAFFESALKESILGFWLPRCEDKQFGGFLNCFDNKGETLVSYDKYAWSQGRFVWLFSRLASTFVPMFSDVERKEFLRLAAQGANFLMKHCLISEQDWRCVFVMDRDGSHKSVTPDSPLDMSIYADCFVILGLGMYSYAAGDGNAYQFAKKLYISATQRIHDGKYNTLPYPLSSGYRAHGIPMIFSNTARELYRAALVHDVSFASALVRDMDGFSLDILDNFVDEHDVLHEVITNKNQFFSQILGQHQNPGHTIEDVWFLLDTSDICKHPERKAKILRVMKKALVNGWDEQYGGLLHFCGVDGGKPDGQILGVEDEPMTQQLSGWADKLWWVHSEALYSTLRCYIESSDNDFLDWFKKVMDYTFATFPHPNREIGEWIQIRSRDGSMQEKVVALPVKDPFHIARNFILILEMLAQKSE